MPPKKKIFRITFTSQGKSYELYARNISQSEFYGFVVVEDILYGERSSIVVDPAEEQLKLEFKGVCRTMVPYHAVQRIDEVEKEGAGKVIQLAAHDSSPAAPTILPPRSDKPR
jgi:hypothetical protein